MTTTPVVLNIDQNRGFRFWNLAEIYLGEDTPGRFVPNLDDAVLDWEKGLFKVVYIDPTTYVPTLARMDTAKFLGPDVQDEVLGVGPGYLSENYRLYVDKTVTPAVITVDSRVNIKGSDNVKCKIFMGSDISDNGTVISAHYNQSGALVSDALDLELVDDDPNGTKAIKVPRTGHTRLELHDGELLTLVAYNNANTPTYIIRLLALNTNFVKRGNAPVRHVTGIRLISPQLSKTEHNTLHYPLNLPLKSMLIEGVVEYSDGGSVKHNIDGTTMVLHGLENYLATIPDQEIPLTLTYKLDEDETSYMAVSPAGTVAAQYKAVTIDEDVIYNVKLFVAPQWKGNSSGYALRFFLYNTERDIALEVTDKVGFDTVNAMAFQPYLYGVKQSLAAVLDLSAVDQRWMSYRHVQTFDITLLSPPYSREQPWLIDYNSDGESVYGGEVHADAVQNIDGKYDFYISGYHTELSDWLTDVYLKIDPLIDRSVEGSPIIPTHMRVIIDKQHEFYRPVTQWRDGFEVDFIPNSECTVDIQWTKETGTNTLELGLSTLSLYIPPAS